MMTLQEFVREALTEIVNGVVEAQEATRQHGGVVNPPWQSISTTALGGYSTPDEMWAQPVSFDVAVTAAATAGTDAKVGVFTGIFGGGVGANESEQTSQVSRIKFTVFVTLPRPGNRETTNR